MLFDTLKRAILRGNYINKEEMAEKLSLLYSAGKITDEQDSMIIDLATQCAVMEMMLM